MCIRDSIYRYIRAKWEETSYVEPYISPLLWDLVWHVSGHWCMASDWLKIPKNSWKLDKVDKTRCTCPSQANNRYDVRLANCRVLGVWFICTWFYKLDFLLNQSDEVHLFLAKNPQKKLKRQREETKEEKRISTPKKSTKMEKKEYQVPGTSYRRGYLRQRWMCLL